MNERATILLVDDSEDDLLLLHEGFRQAQCKHPLQDLHNGEEAIAYLKGDGPYADRNKFPLPVVMLLDLNMPKKNGYDVLAWARGQPTLKQLPIYVLTASTRCEDVEIAYQLGATAFFVKPSKLDTLTALMRCLCDWIQFNHFPTLAQAVGNH